MLKSCKAMLSVLVIMLAMALNNRAQAVAWVPTTSFNWTNTSGGPWTTDGNWSSAGDPSAVAPMLYDVVVPPLPDPPFNVFQDVGVDQATLPDLSTPYTVTLSSARTIGQLFIDLPAVGTDVATLSLSNNLTIRPGWDFAPGTESENHGAIDINNSTLWIQTDTFVQGGIINASGGTLLVGHGGSGNQTSDVDTVIDWTAGNDITDPYKFKIQSAAEVTVNRSTAWNVLSGQTIEFGANTPGSNNDITVLTLDRDMTNSGKILMGTSSLGFINQYLTINSTDSKLTNNADGLIEMYPRSATTTGDPWSIRRLQAELDNQGEFNVYTHRGVIGKTADAGIDHVNSGTFIFDDTVLDVLIPNVDFTGNSLTNTATGTIGGNGIINLSGNVNANTPVAALISGELTNDGTLSPGLSAGTLAVTGNVTNSATSMLEIEIGGLIAGTEYDELTISGTFAIDGELLVTLIGGFDGSILNSDSFTIATFGLSSGTFSNLFDSRVSVPDVFIDGFGTSFLVTNTGNSIVLSDFGQNPVPEPSSLALLGLGIFGLIGRARRNRRRA